MTDLTYNFAGKTALVTGAAGGIGRATALAYASSGANVIVTDIQTEGGEETTHAIKTAGGEAIFVRSDVTSPDDVDALIDTCMSAYGRIDFACNNAAVELEDTALADVKDETARRVMDINFMGVFLCMKREISAMLGQGGGSIVNVASMNALRSRADSAVYDGTKAAVLAMTRSAALGYTARNIRINAVCPGVTDTPMLALKMSMVGAERSMIEQVANLEKRLGRPEELAAAILWLSSDAASLVTGHALPVEGGYLLTGAIPNG
ncbi:glucose 1-dehydrogenase [Sphingobium sp. ZW T5_29]|uniref:glucose 1-dehydrogenase n=1 Tax=Sphingobium sp. ZW T5_29 TaxID=3378077 RepID=UPI00385494D9